MGCLYSHPGKEMQVFATSFSHNFVQWEGGGVSTELILRYLGS